MFIKVALDGGLSEGFIICGRTILGAAVLLPMAIRAGADARRSWTARGRRSRWPPMQVIVPFGLITFGENYVPSSLAGILVATAPLFITLLAIKVDPDERSRGWGLVGVVLGMVGVVLLFGVDLTGDTKTLRRRPDDRRLRPLLRDRRPDRQARLHGRAAGRRRGVQPRDLARSSGCRSRSRRCRRTRRAPTRSCRCSPSARAAPASRSCSSTPRSPRSARRAPRSSPTSRRVLGGLRRGAARTRT